MKKVALAVVLLSLIALPSCKSGKKEEVVTTTTEVRTEEMPAVLDMSKELAGSELDGYEADGYENERLAENN
jgi:hypothetical protein